MATRTDEPLIVRSGGLEYDDDMKAEQLRYEINQTRNHMARSVDAIEERLSPKNIKAQITSIKEHLTSELSGAKSAAKNKVREATVGRVENMVHDARETVSEAGATTASTIKSNPIPAALVAVGLGWLIASGMKSGGRKVDNRIRARSRDRDQWYGYREGGPYDGIDEDGYAFRYRHEPAAVSHGVGEHGRRRIVQRGRRIVGNVSHKASEVGHDVASRAKEVAGDAQERAGQVAHEAGDAVRSAGMKGRRMVRRAGSEARRAERTIEHQLRDNPLAAGALALAVGAAIGLLLPHTDVEDRLIGEKKDRLLDSAKHKAQSAAHQALSSVQDKASGIAEQAGGVAERAGDLASRLESERPREGGPQNGLANGLSKNL